MTVRQLSEYVRQAERAAPNGGRRKVARRVIAEVRAMQSDPDDIRGVLRRLLRFAQIDLRAIERFEMQNAAVRVGRKGRTIAWLAPLNWTTALVPPAPRFSPRGMRLLAEALVEELADAH